jgi:hypothetical protein
MIKEVPITTPPMSGKLGAADDRARKMRAGTWESVELVEKL